MRSENYGHRNILKQLLVCRNNVQRVCVNNNGNLCVFKHRLEHRFGVLVNAESAADKNCVILIERGNESLNARSAESSVRIALKRHEKTFGKLCGHRLIKAVRKSAGDKTHSAAKRGFCGKDCRAGHRSASAD